MLQGSMLFEVPLCYNSQLSTLVAAALMSLQVGDTQNMPQGTQYMMCWAGNGKALINNYLQGGSNMTGINCDLFTHKQSQSYLNHLVTP
jgi:hypothetical protein